MCNGGHRWEKRTSTHREERKESAFPFCFSCQKIYVAYDGLQQTIMKVPYAATYLQSKLRLQGLDSIHSLCTQTSSSSLEQNLGHSCRTPLNPLLCQCSSPEIHSAGQEVDRSQLELDYMIFSVTYKRPCTPILDVSTIMKVNWKSSTSHRCNYLG